MAASDIESLNDQFSVPDPLSFKSGPGGLVVAEIDNALASATVALVGAHVMTFQPKGHEPVLWMSKHSYLEVGKPIRGGIPVCWPWFTEHPTNPDLPNHGFARIVLWNVAATRALPDGGTELRLTLADTEETRTMWPQGFQLELVVAVGSALTVELAVTNTDPQPVTWTGALHSYFSVRDVAHAAVHGLDGCAYIDTVGPRERKVQEGPIAFVQETDRVYVDTAAECVIDDPGLDRRIHIAKQGSQTTVVWNPWVEKSKRMPDFGDDEYPGMVGVETANAEDGAVTVAPGGEHRMSAVIRVEEGE